MTGRPGPADAAAADPTAIPRLPDLHRAGPLPRRAWVRQVMGLPVSVHLRGPDARGPRAEASTARFYDHLTEIDRRFSPWKPESEVSRIQRGDLTVPQAHPDVRVVARLCREAHERTGGWFDAWLPGPDGARRFDPTGLVKGWAVEGAARAFDALVHDAPDVAHDVLVIAGGDILARSGRGDTPDWRIGIDDPGHRGRLLATLPLRDGAVATSGHAARGPHIVDPRTGGHPDALLSATVIGASLTWADVFATAAFAAGAGAAEWFARADPPGLLHLFTCDRSGTRLTVGGPPPTQRVVSRFPDIAGTLAG